MYARERFGLKEVEAGYHMDGAFASFDCRFKLLPSAHVPKGRCEPDEIRLLKLFQNCELCRKANHDRFAVGEEA
jgi:hypothetical protein